MLINGSRPRAIALMGPTASGKSAYALELAQRLDGEIVSVDSALVYRGLDIGAAKPTREEQAQAPHHLVDVREPWQPYSAAEFAADARRAIDGIVARGKLPILAGGTGLYFRALLHGMSAMPEADADLRASLTAEAAERGWPAMHADLARADPVAAARIGINDAQRIQRALEVWRLSGRPISEWQRSESRSAFPWRVLKLAIAPRDRSLLHARIAERFDVMLASGLIGEVQALRADARLHAALPSMRAVGYRQAWEHLDGAFDRTELRQRGIAATRQLAKRQLTWLRSEFDARWFDPEQQREELDRAVLQFIRAR